MKVYSRGVGFKMVSDYGLEKIVKEYKIVLFDSSSLIDPFCGSRYKGVHNEYVCSIKTNELQKKIDYILFLQECLRKNYPFYVTEKIIKEINRGGGHAKNYRIRLRHSTYPKKRRVFVSPKTIEREGSEFNRLVSLFLNNHVIKLTDSETGLYSNFSSDFFYLMKLEELSETDFDFLIKGIVLSESRGKTALLANDSGIRKAWFHLTKRQIFHPTDLVLFKSIGLDNFVESQEYPKEIKSYYKNILV
jgi:hypothetical protein